MKFTKREGRGRQGSDPVEKDPRARCSGLWRQNHSTDFRRRLYGGLYETQAHEERGRGEEIRVKRIDRRGGGGNRRNVNSNCQILKLPAS